MDISKRPKSMDISKRPKSLLKDFNGTDATVLGVTAAAVPAIAVSILDLEV